MAQYPELIYWRELRAEMIHGLEEDLNSAFALFFRPGVRAIPPMAIESSRTKDTSVMDY